MDNYVKDYIREVEDQSGLPFNDSLCTPNVIHMKVKTGTKVKNIVDYSVKHFMDSPSERQIVISGLGDASNKAITCAEILKHNYENKLKQNLYQMTQIRYKTFEEFWKPKDINLDVLKVVRKVPQIYILLSKDSLDLNSNGVQYKDHNICNQLKDKNDLKANTNKYKHNRNKSKPNIREKNSRKPDNGSKNEMNDTKRRQSQT